MPNIRVDLESPVFYGQDIIFKSPADCSTVTGLIVYYPDGGSTTSKVFQFADAHGNNVGSVSLFSENVLVTVILDTMLNRAYVQNADTNAYLERQFASKAPIGLVHQTLDGGSSLSTLHTALLNQFNAMSESTVRLFVVSFSASYSPFKGQKTTLTVQKLTSTSGVIKADLHGNEVLDTPSMTLWNVIINNSLDEWEYDNPPFLLNNEYRTTERFKGKAVYKRLTEKGIEYRLDGEDTWALYSSILGIVVPEVPVKSVNTKTGDVELTASDVGALPINGGSMKGPISFTGVQDILDFGISGWFRGMTTSGSRYNIFGYSDPAVLQVGGSYPALSLKGKNERPTYNDAEMALRSDAAPEIFVAEYDTTTETEIQEALNAGLTIYCKYTDEFNDEYILPLIAENFSGLNIYVFSAVASGYNITTALYQNASWGMGDCKWGVLSTYYPQVNSSQVLENPLIAQNNTNYTTKQVRNIILVADGEEIPAGANGDICLVYTP